MALKKYFALSIIAASVAMSACSSDDDDDGGDGNTTAGMTDAGMTDAGMTDAGMTDAGMTDAGMTDAGVTPPPVTDMSTNTGTSILDVARGTDGDDEDTDIDADDTNGGTPPNPDLTSLVSAAAAYPGILNLLDDESQTLTVFAPNNDAFAALTETPDAATLERILSYHVINGTNLDGTTVSSLTPDTPTTYPTAAGPEITVTLDGSGAVSLTDGMGNVVPVIATVESPTNGTVHVIGSILMPPAEMAPGGTDGGTPPGGNGDGEGDGGGGAEGSTRAAITGDGDLSSLAGIIGDRAQSLEATDDTNRSQIIFAPRNDAIDAGATSILAYTVTDGMGTQPGGPVAAGTYTSFAGLDGTGPGLTFNVTGEGESLMVNGQPATLVQTSSGPVLIVYGGGAQ